MKEEGKQNIKISINTFIISMTSKFQQLHVN